MSEGYIFLQMKDELVEDISLIEGCLKNNRKSQNKLFSKYAGYVMGIARRYMKDEYEAKDIFLRSFEKVFRNIDKYDSEKGIFKVWLKVITIREALGYLRSEKRFGFIELDEQVSSSSLVSMIDDLEVNEIINIVNQLNDPYGIIFNMVIDGYKHKEIAKKFEITEATSRSYYYRSRKMIIRILEANNIKSSHE